MCAFDSALQKEILEQISSQTSGLVSVGYLMAKGGELMIVAFENNVVCSDVDGIRGRRMPQR